jgi:hypothetical protein
MIMLPNGAPANEDTVFEDLPAEARAKLPEENKPFAITDEMRACLSWQQQEALVEEACHRQLLIRHGYHCEVDPRHNRVQCPRCYGIGERISPEGAKAPCMPCNGKGMVPHPAPMVWGCKHVYPQDQVHPVGLVKHPRLYYFCLDCFKLAERKRFRFSTEMVIRCLVCLNLEVVRLSMLNPDLVRDLSKK